MFLRGGLSVEHRSVASSNSIVTDYHYAAFAGHTLSLEIPQRNLQAHRWHAFPLCFPQLSKQ